MAANQTPALAGPSRPLGAPEIPQFYLPAPSTKGLYAPRLYGAATIQFADRRRRIDETRQVAVTVPLEGNPRAIDWDTAQLIDVRRDQLRSDAPAKGNYLPLPPNAMNPKVFARWAKSFDRWLARTQRLDVPVRPEQPDDPPVIGPKRGGVSVELVAIVWA